MVNELRNEHVSLMVIFLPLEHNGLHREFTQVGRLAYANESVVTQAPFCLKIAEIKQAVSRHPW